MSKFISFFSRCARTRGLALCRRGPALACLLPVIVFLLETFTPMRSLSADSLPPPESAGFEHVIVVMMENRSFDHFFGWLPGANGQQAGLNYSDNSGTPNPT